MAINLGDVLVHLGEPEGGNPYRGRSLMGPARLAALRAFKDGQPDPVHTFWYAPAHGGARRLAGPGEVEWGGGL